jgi:hypothetical protein
MADKEMPEMSFDQQLAAFTISSGVFKYDNLEYPFLVVNQKLRANLDHFVGIYQGCLFISASVPEHFREYIFRHEVRCNILRALQSGRCLQTTIEEIAELSPDMIVEYLTIRRTFYEALVKELPKDSTLYQEISATLAHVRRVHRREILARANPLVAANGLQAEFLEAQSVGVQGDNRTYTDVMVLVGPHPGNEVLAELVSKICSSLPINRVTYELTTISLR